VVRPPYPVAVRLCIILSERWPEIEAAYHASPRPLLRLSPPSILNYVYTWCIERVPHDDLDQWLEDLVDLLPWQDSTSAAAEAVESASFFAMQARQ